MTHSASCSSPGRLECLPRSIYFPEVITPKQSLRASDFPCAVVLLCCRAHKPETRIEA